MKLIRRILLAITILAALSGCSDRGSSGGEVEDTSVAIVTREELAWDFVRATEDFAEAFSNVADDEESVAATVSIFSEIGGRFDKIVSEVEFSEGELSEITEAKMEERIVEAQESFNAAGTKEFSESSGKLIKPAIESVVAKMERAIGALAQQP